MLLLIDNGSVHTPELRAYLKKRGVHCVIANPDSPLEEVMRHRYKGAILSGGPLMLDEKIDIDDIDIDLAILLDLDVPTLGICLGHQTIAKAFDGELKRLRTRVRKQEKITITRRCALFKGLPNRVYMQEYHTDCVYKAPYNFEVIARSASCAIEGIKHKKKQIFGLQFHPEASGVMGERILDNFLDICGIRYRKSKVPKECIAIRKRRVTKERGNAKR